MATVPEWVATPEQVHLVIAARDAQERTAGIVRVDTRDEATVSEIVWAIINHNTLSGSDLDGTARAVLAALRGEQ